jgi:hypothetical protein
LNSITERLLDWFYSNEAHLHQWVDASVQNAHTFAVDPVTAIRSAGLQLDDELVCELESVARALRSVPSEGYD